VPGIDGEASQPSNDSADVCREIEINTPANNDHTDPTQTSQAVTAGSYTPPVYGDACTVLGR